MHLIHFLAVVARRIRAALFSSGPSSPSFSGPSEMPGIPSFRGRLKKPNPQTKHQKGGKTDEYFAIKMEKVRRRKPTLAATPTPLLAQREHQKIRSI